MPALCRPALVLPCMQPAALPTRLRHRRPSLPCLQRAAPPMLLRHRRPWSRQPASLMCRRAPPTCLSHRPWPCRPMCILCRTRTLQHWLWAARPAHLSLCRVRLQRPAHLSLCRVRLPRPARLSPCRMHLLRSCTQPAPTPLSHRHLLRPNQPRRLLCCAMRASAFLCQLPISSLRSRTHRQLPRFRLRRPCTQAFRYSSLASSQRRQRSLSCASRISTPR
mmetsp:Transcript_22577/g.58058  ORF Transcript_22577/g.58058 Transcript_22577/m.58058 type:complete len:221 (+) Transcript_22577:1434-2096(+)